MEYPFFPAMSDLMKLFALKKDLEQNFPVLHLFIQDYQKLQVGSEILSDLVDFYQWLHVDMNETLTREEAFDTTVASKVNEFAEKYADTVHLPEIYKRVQGSVEFKEYKFAMHIILLLVWQVYKTVAIELQTLINLLDCFKVAEL